MKEKKTFRHSRQRQKILELLQNSSEHPSADWIYEKMKESFPSISLGTVYRNLGVLHSQGLLTRLMYSGGADRFDTNTHDHSHFYCEVCGSIYDTDDWEQINQTKKLPLGHKVERRTTSYFGTCRRCLSQNNQ